MWTQQRSSPRVPGILVWELWWTIPMKQVDFMSPMPIILGGILFENIFNWKKVKYDFFTLYTVCIFLSFFMFYFLFSNSIFRQKAWVLGRRYWCKYSFLYSPVPSTTQTFRLSVFYIFIFVNCIHKKQRK